VLAGEEFMKSGKIGNVVAATLIAVALVLTLAMMRERQERGTRADSQEVNIQTPAVSSSSSVIAQPLVMRSDSTSARSISSRSMLGWQRDLYDPQTTAKTFAEAVDAAEAGDLFALREVHDLLAICKTIIEYVREGGSRERYLSDSEIPPNGIQWRGPFYDRCAAIATATAFAGWPLTEGRLTASYWEDVGRRLDDPLLHSFAIAEDILSYDHAEIGRRTELRARMVDNLHRVLRSGDPGAWWDLGFRLLNPQLTADKAVGIALVQVACERGLDCSQKNVHNWTLRCDGSSDPNCGSATTNLEAFAQRESAATMARAQALSERLTLLLNTEDRDEIEEVVQLDGAAFK
jgi:hypothetical protein